MKNSKLTIGSIVNFTNGNETIHSGVIKAERFHELHDEIQFLVKEKNCLFPEWIYSSQIK